MTHTLIIAGTDFSSYIQDEVGISEQPVYIDGENSGSNILGGAIWDRQGVRYKNTFTLKPLPQSNFNVLRRAAQANSAVITMTTSRSASAMQITGQITLSAYSFALNALGERIYTGATITIEAKDAEV